MNPKTFPSWLCFGAALLSMIAALFPLTRGSRLDGVFLSVAVVFFAVGVSMARRGR